jgi:predicted nuclease of predicted toxin-antitoxin system
VRFLVDAQLPPVLAHWLREAGHDARHVEDVNLREAEDSPIWRYALENRTILITKDEDFAERARQGGNTPEILWLRIGNVSNRALRQWFLPQLPQIIEWIEQGVRVLEIR